ncbi:hypothetical protein ACT009_01495 [Sphingomonas sp. Tas61C01]|jgi:hypothetical protein|uniref:hypothetical protein n=1 Tax=Sphingomonas sp. Tas61C01 TaxID=3458297 RepID=UPI00403ED5AD
MTPLVKIDRYLRRTKMPPTKFGRLAVNDPRLVGDLKRGRNPGPKMMARIDAFIGADGA